MKEIEKRNLLCVFIIMVLFGCRANPDSPGLPPNTDPEEKQIDKYELMKGSNTIETITTENAEIIINNPYKNKGSLNLKGAYA